MALHHLHRVAVLLPLLVSASCATTAPDSAGPEERWLLSWIGGTAAYEFDPGFHEEYPLSPHRRDSEHFEVAVKCLRLRQDGDAVRRLVLLGRISEGWAQGVPGDSGEVVRTLVVLEFLADRTALPLIRKALESTDVAVRGMAVGSPGTELEFAL